MSESMPILRCPAFLARLAPLFLTLSLIAGIVLACQGLAFLYAADDSSISILYLKRHARLVVIAGIALLLAGSAGMAMIQRISALERRLEMLAAGTLRLEDCVQRS